MNKFQRTFKNQRETILVYALMIVVVSVFVYMQHDLTKFGITSLFNQCVTLVVVAFPQTIAILLGGIDMSIGPMIALCNCVLAMSFEPLIGRFGETGGIIIAVLLTLLVGALCGTLNGSAIVFGKLQPIIVTIATASIYSGVALYVCPLPGGNVPRKFSKFLSGRVFDVIPMALILILFFTLVVWRVFRNSRLGHAIYAIGGNEYSAFLSGINVERSKMKAYIFCGLLAACAGIILTSQSSSGDATGGSSYAVNSITSAVMGGALLSGGQGTYIASVAGAIILSLLNGILLFFQVSSYYTTAIQGALLLLVLSIYAFSRIRRVTPTKQEEVSENG